MSSEPNRVVFHGSRVLLPGLDELVEASIVVDAEKGTILSVVQGPVSKVVDDYGEVVEAGDTVILPGLVE
jgi:imidazolonepropionase-like amidohydrolase